MPSLQELRRTMSCLVARVTREIENDAHDLEPVRGNRTARAGLAHRGGVDILSATKLDELADVVEALTDAGPTAGLADGPAS